MNHITLIGNVGKEPELRFTPANKAVVKFSVADTRGQDDKKKTVWHTVVAFDEQAQNVAEHVQKGTRVIVTGRLNKASFEGRDGVKREVTELIADEIGLSIRFGSGNKRPASMHSSVAEALIQAEFGIEEEPF
jgi:single-strand DNA-binding protein